MTEQTLTLADLKKRSLDEVLQEIAAQDTTLTVLLPNGQEIVMGPRPRLKPLPELEGRLPDGWKDALYG